MLRIATRDCDAVGSKALHKGDQVSYSNHCRVVSVTINGEGATSAHSNRGFLWVRGDKNASTLMYLYQYRKMS